MESADTGDHDRVDIQQCGMRKWFCCKRVSRKLSRCLFLVVSVRVGVDMMEWIVTSR